MTHYQLDANDRTAKINAQEVDPQQYPVLRRMVDDMRNDGITALSYYDAVGLGSAEGQDFSASWGPYTVTITVPWDSDCDLDDVFSALEYTARDARRWFPHALDCSAKIFGPAQVNVSFGERPYVSVYRGATRVAATMVDEHLDLPMRDVLRDWCTEMSAYARGINVPPFLGAVLSKDSVMFRDADLVQHRQEDAPGTENVARELQARFDELINQLESLDQD